MRVRALALPPRSQAVVGPGDRAEQKQVAAAVFERVEVSIH
jgi:hypothetical protein